MKALKKKKKKGGTPVDFSKGVKPSFSGKSMSRETAKKKVISQLEKQGITGSDQRKAMQRGKLTMDSSGNYSFKTDAYSKADE
jgi:hypothetical protein